MKLIGIIPAKYIFNCQVETGILQQQEGAKA